MKKLISVLMVLVVVSAVNLTLASFVQAASQIFVKIEGVRGQSTDAMHSGWIDATGFADKVFQPGGSTFSSGTRTTEKASFNDILIAKKMDIASPRLFDLCASGKHVPRVQIDFVESTSRGKVVVAMYYLEDVVVSSVEKNFDPKTGEVMEQVTFKFAKIKQVITDVMNPRGGKEEAGWDLVRGTSI